MNIYTYTTVQIIRNKIKSPAETGITIYKIGGPGGSFSIMKNPYIE